MKKEWECCGDIAQILGENKEIIPIQMEEEMFLKSMCDDSHHIEMSRGYIRDGFTTVTEGALCGKEKWIRKIDRHKRLAKLELPCGGRWKETQVGLEIVKKE